MSLSPFDGATGARPALVPPGEDQLEEPLGGDEGDREDEDQHRKRTCSAEKPGPRAEMVPYSPLPAG